VAGVQSSGAGRENRDFMTINKQTIKLYWVTTDDHDEDWFILGSPGQ
jgi:lipocalin